MITSEKSIPGMAIYGVAVENETPSNSLLIPRPTSVLVSSRYPGSKFFEVGLQAAAADDESLAVLLVQAALEMSADGSEGYTRLMELREMLVDGTTVVNIINAVLPRGSVTLQRGTYYMTEEQISLIVMEAAGSSDVHAITRLVFTKLITRALHALGFVSTGVPEWFAVSDKTLALDPTQLRQLYVIEKMRPVLSGALITAKLRDVDLGKKNASGVVAQRISDALAAMGTAISQVSTAIREYDTAIGLVAQSYIDETTVPQTVRESAELATMKSFANFVVMAKNPQITSYNMSEYEFLSALRNVARAIAQLPAVSAISLDTYASYFLSTPIVNRLGVSTGAVVALPLAQTSSARVVQATEINDVVHLLEALPPTITPAPVVAALVNRTLISIDMTRALMHQLADALSDENGSGQLITLGVSDLDMEVLAIARSRQLLLASIAGAQLFVYGISSENAIGVRSNAAVGALLFYVKPEQAITFTTSRERMPETALPQRTTSLPKTAPTLRVAKFKQRVAGGVQAPFIAKYEIQISGEAKVTPEGLVLGPSVTTALELVVNMTGSLPDLTTRRTSISVIVEPAAQEEVTRNLMILDMLMKSEDRAVAFRAIATLASVLQTVIVEPMMLGMAERALLQSVVNAKLDLRVLAPYAKRAFFQTAVVAFFASLVRLQYLTAEAAGPIIADLPYDELAISAGRDIEMPRALMLL